MVFRFNVTMSCLGGLFIDRHEIHTMFITRNRGNEKIS